MRSVNPNLFCLHKFYRTAIIQNACLTIICHQCLVERAQFKSGFTMTAIGKPVLTIKHSDRMGENDTRSLTLPCGGSLCDGGRDGGHCLCAPGGGVWCCQWIWREWTIPVCRWFQPTVSRQWYPEWFQEEEREVAHRPCRPDCLCLPHLELRAVLVAVGPYCPVSEVG